jgi:hypothetical protein
MSDAYGTEPMFPLPERYKPPKRKMKFPNWRQHTGKRTSCDICIMALARGEVKFMVDNAAHVRTDENGRKFYCARHAQSKKLQDERGNLL